VDQSKFLADLELAERYWSEDGETLEGVEEIKQAIRNDWKEGEKRDSWAEWIAWIADFQRELLGMASRISDRVKSQQVNT
jgi:hypothetical protein